MRPSPTGCRTRGFLCAVLLLLLLFPFLSAQAQGRGQGISEYRAVKAAEWARIKRAIPVYLWLQNRTARKKSRVDRLWDRKNYGKVLLNTRQFKELAEILRSGSPYTTEKNKNPTLEIPTGKKVAGGRAEKMPVPTLVTSQYRPGCGKSFPLIITCHGGPQPSLSGARSAAATQFAYWKGYADTLKCIVAAPALTGSKFGDREWTFLENLIDELDRLYNVDRDRILLTGHSWGGILTWHLGPPHADRFAVLAPFVCAINPGRTLLSNCRALPIYHVQGQKDIPWILQTGRERREVLNALGYTHVYREMPGGHEGFPGEIRKIADYFTKHPRNIYAPKLVRADTRSGRNRCDDWYWVRSPTHTFQASIDRKGRIIQVDIDGPFEVFLADAMLDLDKPLEIQRRGKTVWKGFAERRLDFTLDHVRKTEDRCRIFAASVKVK
jgi:pimeloyl-ACP methyl ester carboxylesterase